MAALRRLSRLLHAPLPRCTGHDGRSAEAVHPTPASFPQLACLDEVSVRLDSCGLTEVPEEVLVKATIRELVLSRNSLRMVPVEIQAIATLRVLRLDRNKLQKLPAEVGNLAFLNVLDLQGNLVSMHACSVSPGPGYAGPPARRHGAINNQGAWQLCTRGWSRTQLLLL